MAEQNNDAQVSGDLIKITVKTPKTKHEIEIPDGSTIKELKEIVAKKFETQVAQLCLIFAGKILKDDETLTQHSIKDGLTVHLVIKVARNTDTNTSTTTASQQATPEQVNATPYGVGSLGGLAGLGNMGLGTSNFMELQQQMQQEMMRNPEMMGQIMNNPLVQNLIQNPNVMRDLITSNPNMRDLMDQNPEITHILNNPDLMRQTMELVRNPSMMQELMRNQDRAMSNLESIPGGFNALQRMYHDIQEPMLNAAQEGFRPNPFASLVNSTSSTSTTSTPGTENTTPLPNPWANNPTTTTSSTTTRPTTNASSTSLPGGPFGMFNSPGMQSLMQQITDNPQLMENMMQAPYTQSMMQTLAANPDMAERIMSANPLFQGNPQLQEHFRQHLPALLNQMQNPAMQEMMQNPRAMQAMMQIQQGMQQLQSEVPSAFTGMTGQPANVTLSGTTNTTTSNTTTTTTTTTPSGPGSGQDELSTMMAQIVQLMSQGQNQNSVNPEERYASQMETLILMGFTDRAANLRALTATAGDINAAVDHILDETR